MGKKVTFKGFKDICYLESGEPAAISLGVPLSIQGQPIGVMAVQDYQNGQAYGEDEKRILAFVATQTALAVEPEARPTGVAANRYSRTLSRCWWD